MIRRAALLFLSVLALHAIVAMPATPDTFRPASWLRFAPELAMLLTLLLVLGAGAAGRALRIAATLALTALTVLKLADIAMILSLGRRFNPVADLALVDASIRLIAGATDPARAVLAVAGALIAIAGIAALLFWAMGRWMRAAPPRAARIGLAAVMAVLLLAQPPQTALGQFALHHVTLGQRTMAELARFRKAAARDDAAGISAPLARIDRDVIVIFLESYGRASFDIPRYADRHLPVLREAETRLAEAGLAMRSGFLTSPTHGGQSWLMHTSLASGLRIDGQTRYRAALASGRKTLFHIAQGAGFRTAAVMPAITQPWPESGRMGFETVLDAKGLGYRGLPFNWVTMPDQFTLTAMDRMLRQGHDPRRLFAQVALISSHAPWVPVPQVLDWDSIGDGREFDAMAQAGDPPAVVWRDRERVRDQYGKAIDYVLRVATGYALRHAGDPPLLLLVGDHQAASSIGLDDRREVPIHVIGPADLVERSADWGLTPGLIPPKDAPARPAEDVRLQFLKAFSGHSDSPPA